jgi:hypothetical protein
MPDYYASPSNNHLPTPVDRQEAGDDSAATVSFLPSLVSRALVAGWILLFAVRWIVIQGMDAAGLLNSQTVTAADLDAKFLRPVYLVLLSVSLIVLLLRIARSRSSSEDPSGSKRDVDPQSGPALAAADAVEVAATDRGGKQA